MTDLYAVMGAPIAHSKSPEIHAAFARATRQDLEYRALWATPDGFAVAADRFRAAGGRGLNVTAPFKLDAFAYAKERSTRAERAGAVNALWWTGDRLLGENFDGVGLIRDLQHNLATPLAARRILILGAGGATRGLLQPLLEQHPALVTIVNRTAVKAGRVAQAFADLGPIQGAGYDLLAGEFDIVVNATSASPTGAPPPLPAPCFAPGCLAYDLGYGRGMTSFLRAARSAGARLADGTGMLVEQAAEAFAWWRGIYPATGPVIAALRVPLA